MFNLANQLTLFGFFIVPIILLLFSGEDHVLAAVLFGIAWHDFLDGHIARKGMVTKLQKVSLPTSCLSAHPDHSTLSWGGFRRGDCRHHWPNTVTGLRAMAIDEGVVIAADKYGKVKPSCRSSPSFPLVIILLGVNVHLIGNFLLYIALVLTIFFRPELLL